VELGAFKEMKVDSRTIQQLADDFNLKYNEACHTSNPVDWGQAALAARQMVDAMAERGIISDSLPDLQNVVTNN
jgi:hypothetical protein